MEAGQALQFGSTWLLNIAFSLMLGLLSARHWLTDAEGGWGGALRQRLEGLWRPAGLACLAGQFAALWSAAAAMAGVAPAAAGPALLTMLGATAFGKAGLLGLACAAAMAAGGAALMRGAAGRGAALVLLALFALARAANSHAAEQGLASLGLLVEWIHLMCVALWLGAVCIGAWLVMRDKRHAPVRYMERLSAAASLAIAGIVATGIYNSWHGLGSPAQALGNPYGTALIVKVTLVLLAAAMGGYNKFVAFPQAQEGNQAALLRARLVLQVESLVLAGAMLAAAVLVAQQPPAMAGADDAAVASRSMEASAEGPAIAGVRGDGCHEGGMPGASATRCKAASACCAGMAAPPTAQGGMPDLPPSDDAQGAREPAMIVFVPPTPEPPPRHSC